MPTDRCRSPVDRPAAKGLGGRRLEAALPVLAALALSACGPRASERRCGGEQDCPPTARCIAGSCVANAAPSPTLALPSRLEAHALLSFDASASADADPDDGIASWRWTFRSLDAPCEAPAVAGAGPVATVRFGCAGRYAVALEVADQLGERAAAEREFTVLPRAGPALVTAAPDVVVEHLCAGAPLRCAPASTVVLSASATGLPAADLAWAWRVEAPPDRPLGAGRRVTFAPGAEVASPTVLVETDGQAISGDWVFRVEARDAAGVVGDAAMRVSVRNREPTVQASLPTFHHTFDGAAFRVAEEIVFAVLDPDGDPLVGPSVGAHQTGAGAGTISASIVPGASRIGVSIAVPYGSPADAGHLIGGDGLARSVSLDVLDVNGGRALVTWPIVVANRPPVLVGGPATAAVDHGYHGASRRYVARAELSVWEDPDGDPLLAGVTGDAACPQVVVPDGSGPRRASADCSAAAEGPHSLAAFAGPRSVVQRIRDPWAEAAPSVASFVIANRAPVVTTGATEWVAGACALDGGWCLRDYEYTYTQRAAAVSTALARYADPDGDPLWLTMPATAHTAAANGLPCWDAPCAFWIHVEAMTVCGSTAAFTAYAEVSDGVATAADVVPFERACSPPPG